MKSRKRCTGGHRYYCGAAPHIDPRGSLDRMISSLLWRTATCSMLREPSSCPRHRCMQFVTESIHQGHRVVAILSSSWCQRSYNLAYCSLFLFALLHSSSATALLIRARIKAILCKIGGINSEILVICPSTCRTWKLHLILSKFCGSEMLQFGIWLHTCLFVSYAFEGWDAIFLWKRMWL